MLTKSYVPEDQANQDSSLIETKPGSKMVIKGSLLAGQVAVSLFGLFFFHVIFQENNSHQEHVQQIENT